MSRRISQLEQALGFGRVRADPLRISSSTISANGLLTHAETIESSVLKVHAEVSETEPEATGTVRLGHHGRHCLPLPRAARAVLLKEAAPHITLELVTSPQLIHVNRREADLFLSFFRPPGQGLVSEKIGGFKLGLYAARILPRPQRDPDQRRRNSQTTISSPISKTLSRSIQSAGSTKWYKLRASSCIRPA